MSTNDLERRYCIVTYHGKTIPGFGGYTLTNFCGFCGRPLTDTARQMLEKCLK